MAKCIYGYFIISLLLTGCVSNSEMGAGLYRDTTTVTIQENKSIMKDAIVNDPLYYYHNEIEEAYLND